MTGLRDTNHARVRATERYLASTCDEVFIVAGILRCVANESIYDTIKKCGTTKRIRIVCTRADVFRSYLRNLGIPLTFINRKFRRKSLLAVLIISLAV